MDTTHLLQLAALLFTGLYPIYQFWLVPLFTRSWPRASAKIIEIEPQSTFEKSGDTYYLNRDTDYAIKYNVGGKDYVHKGYFEANIRAGSIKVWRAPTILDSFSIRYRADNPTKISYAHAMRPYVKVIVSIGCYILFIVVAIDVFSSEGV